MRCLLDTDIVSELLRRRNAQVMQKAASYRQQYQFNTISVVTRFEVLRGLRFRRATTQLAVFSAWCRVHQMLLLDVDIAELAADIWVALARAGQPIGDDDILIAATALHHGLAVATRNVAHFGRVPGLTVEDWSQP